jgi:hypothetical protein
MSDSMTNDLFKHSVTAPDMPEYVGGGVVNFIIPWFMLSASNLPLPSELPPYWSLRFGVAAYWSRDLILRTTILHESFWGGAVAKTATKAAAKSFDLTGPRVTRYQDMLLDWGGDGYVPSQQRGLLDYLTTNNGEFWEIVRVSNAAGSRIIGLVHLDSLRVIRTGDIETPFLFLDLHGSYHELRDYQVLSLVDMPDPASAALGIGHCAAERAYQKIYTVAVMEQYFKEKITGTGANTLDIVTGVNDPQLQGVMQDGKAEATRRGQIYFQGHIIMGILSQVDMKHVSIPLRELPDGYDHEKELLIAQLAYANAIGIDPQEINPALLAKGALGVGAQSVVREKHLTHLLNRDILPDSVTFAFRERDLRDEKQEADIELTRAQTRTAMITDGTITAQEARQLAADDKDIPQEFLTLDQTEGTAVTDEEKPVADGELQAQPIAPVAPPAPPPPIAVPAVQAQKEIDALIALKESIEAIRLRMEPHD